MLPIFCSYCELKCFPICDFPAFNVVPLKSRPFHGKTFEITLLMLIGPPLLYLAWPLFVSVKGEHAAMEDG